MTVYAPMLGTMWRTLESYGLDPTLVIPEKFYRPDRPPGFNDRIRFIEYDACLAHAASLIQDPALGLRHATQAHPSHLGALGHAWMASSTLRKGLRLGVRFNRMFNEQVTMRLDEKRDLIRVSYRMKQQPTRPGVIADGQLGGVTQLCRFNYGENFKPLRVTLKRSRPPDPEPWLKFFGVDVRFGYRVNSLDISNEVADKPLTSSDPELIALHEDVIRRYLVRMDRDNIVNRTRLEIMEQLPSGRVTEEEIARSFNMSKRTLHRKLKENGETFRTLLTQVRSDLAERYIRDASYSVTEIAFLLGYTDSSAFSRAFKTWFGRSPTQERAA